MSDNVALFPDIHPNSGKRDNSGGRDNNGSGTPPGGSDVEARVAKLESHFEYIRRDLDDLRGDVKEHRKESREDFRVLFGCLIAVALGLAAMMAKGFGWL